MTWFEPLTGITEQSGGHVKSRLRVEGQTLTSLANDRAMVAGEFITPAFYVALQNFQETGCNKLYLTLVGAGVFGNSLEWILAAIGRSFKLFAATELNVSIVCYKASNREVANYVAKQ